MTSNRFPKTLKRVAKLESTLIKKTLTHDIYLCPFCYEKELKYDVKDPKPDTTGKLYIETNRNRGYCFRCCTVVFTNWSILSSFDNLVNILQDDLTQNIDIDDLPEINLSGFQGAFEIDEAMQYLLNRNPAFNKNNVRKLNLKWIDNIISIFDGSLNEWVRMRRKGILTPLTHKGLIKSYQIRYITEDKKHRFHTMDGVKLISVINDIPLGSEISICEGFYDQVALLCMGFPNPVAVLGKFPSDFQVHQLRNLVPIKVNLCMDEESINYSLGRWIKSKLRSVSSTKNWKFDAKDPEEFYVRNQKFRYNS